MEKQNNSKALTLELHIKLMRRFYETWKDIEAKSVVGTTEFQKVYSESATYRQMQDHLRELLSPEEEMKRLITEE